MTATGMYKTDIYGFLDAGFAQYMGAGTGFGMTSDAYLGYMTQKSIFTVAECFGQAAIVRHDRKQSARKANTPDACQTRVDEALKKMPSGFQTESTYNKPASEIVTTMDAGKSYQANLDKIQTLTNDISTLEGAYNINKITVEKYEDLSKNAKKATGDKKTKLEDEISELTSDYNEAKKVVENYESKQKELKEAESKTEGLKAAKDAKEQEIIQLQSNVTEAIEKRNAAQSDEKQRETEKTLNKADGNIFTRTFGSNKDFQEKIKSFKKLQSNFSGSTNDTNKATLFNNMHSIAADLVKTYDADSKQYSGYTKAMDIIRPYAEANSYEEYKSKNG